MGIPGSANLMLLGGGAQAYQIEQSLRFNDDDSAYFQLNGGTSPTDGKIFTHSVWVKRSEISGNDNNVFGLLLLAPFTTTSSLIAMTNFTTASITALGVRCFGV